MNFSDVFPVIHNAYEFMFAVIFLGIQVYQFRYLHSIKKQTNGLVASSVAAAHEAGERVGMEREQERVATKLAVFNEDEHRRGIQKGAGVDATVTD